MISREQFMRETGAALNRERMALGLTQAEIAEALEVDESVVSRWEQGERMLSLYDWTMLQRAFELQDARLRRQGAAIMHAGTGGRRCR